MCARQLTYVPGTYGGIYLSSQHLGGGHWRIRIETIKGYTDPPLNQDIVFPKALASKVMAWEINL